MKPRFLSLTVSMLLVSVLSACASSAPPSATATAPPAATATLADPIPTDLEVATATSTVPPTPVQAVATSRGPNLEATDPATVSLASGKLQLVEFFRFT